MKNRQSDLPRFVCDLLAASPERGGGLNLWLFRVARVLHPFREPAEIIQLLEATTAGEPIRHGEIERAVERSKSCAWRPGEPSLSKRVAPKWPELDQEKCAAVASRGSLADLWEASPIRLDNNVARAERIIDALFPENPLLCVGQSQSSFTTRSREELRGQLSKFALIVPSPMTARVGHTQEGTVSAHTLETTGPRRFLVIEQDRGNIDEQAAVLMHLTEFAPLVLAVHSGSKSIHGWFACLDESEQTLREFMEYAVTLGADPATWTRSQFVRMPDGLRNNGKRQTAFYFNPDALA
jgi:hypothetical protein